ncbi:MAG: hypothetical protein GYB66_00875 [Chloroflexi bacterium]|nr:hypothetical protein [Chloroflexota bacterium]
MKTQNENLLREYLNAGLIQFGYFTTSFGAPAGPIKFAFSLLPSFPALMHATAQALRPLVSTTAPAARLLATYDTIPLGAVLAVETGIPLLYPRHNAPQLAPAFAIEGAADVGNPVTLLTDVLLDAVPIIEIARRSQRVGLPVKRLRAIVATERLDQSALAEHTDIADIRALITLEEMASFWQTNDLISKRLSHAIQDWQSENTPFIP